MARTSKGTPLGNCYPHAHPHPGGRQVAAREPGAGGRSQTVDSIDERYEVEED